MVAAFPGLLLLALSGAPSASPPPVVIAVETIGLDDAEDAALRAMLEKTAVDLALTPIMLDAPLPNGCTSDPACLEATLTSKDAQVLLSVQALQVAGSLQLTEKVASRQAIISGTVRDDVADDIANVSIVPATAAALAGFAAPAQAPSATTPQSPPQGDGRLGLGLAIRADLAMQHGRTFGVTVAEPSLANTLSGEGIKGFGGGFLLQLSWHLPIDGHWLNRAFGVEFDVGYSITGETGTVPFTQYETKNGTTSLVTTNYDYAGLIHLVPMSLGLRSRLPLQDLHLPVHIDVALGGNVLWGLSISTATVQGESVNFATDNAASDFAFGFYAEGGVAFDLGPGELVGAYRYVSSYLDFGHRAFNPTPGDVGGHHLLLGYRFTW